MKRRHHRRGSSRARGSQAETLEKRLMLAAVTLTGSGGDDLIELQTSGANVIGKLNTFEVFNVADTSIDEVVINAGGGADTIYVDQTGNNSVTVNGNAGNDTLHLAELNKVVNLNILGAVHFDGGSENNSLLIHDSAQTSARTDNFGTASLSQNGSFSMSWSNVQGVTLNGGTGGDTVNLSTSFYPLTVNAGDGADTFNVGGGTVDFVEGNLTLNGDGGADTLNYNDSSNAAGSTYTLTSSTLTRSLSAIVTYGGMSQVNLTTGSAGMDIDIKTTATGTSYQVTAAGGDDDFDIIGDDFTVENIKGPVTINGGGGSDHLLYEDTANGFDDTYTLTNQTITRSFSAIVTYQNTEGLALLAGSAANTINVLTTASGTAYEINPGFASDTINVGENNTVEGIQGQINLVSSYGNDGDILNYNDSANAFNDTYLITSNTIGRDFSATLTTTFIDTANLFAGTGDNTINIHASAPLGSADWTVNAGGGTDAINILGSGAVDNVTFAPTTITPNGIINHSAAEIYRFSSGGNTDVLNIDAVTVQLMANAKLSTFGTVNGGTLDMRDHDLVIDYSGSSPIGSWGGSLYTGFTGMIARGYNGGAWDGTGIITSLSNIGDGTMRAVGIGESSFVLGLNGSDTGVWNGMTVDGSCVLIKYTYSGDIDLNGELNGDDYFYLDSYILQSGSTFGYSFGDINLDGELNGDDYFYLDSNILAAQFVGPI